MSAACAAKLGDLPDGQPRIQAVRGRGYVLIGSS